MGEVCRLCGSKDLSPLKNYEKAEYKVCRRCLLLQQSPLREDFGEIFTDNTEYKWGTHDDKFDSDTTFKAHTKNRGIIWELFNKQRPVSKDTHILDFGCGVGYLLNYLKNAGYKNTVGIEPSKDNSAYAKSKELNVINDYLDEDTFKKESFGVIYLQNSGTYIPNIKDIFEIFKTLLKEDGCIFWREKLYNKRPHNIFTGERLPACITAQIFSESSVRNLMKAAGFKVEYFRNDFGEMSLIAVKSDTNDEFHGNYFIERVRLFLIPFSSACFNIFQKTKSRISRHILAPLRKIGQSK